MRYTRKRLTVINDGFCKSDIPAKKRIDAVINRYVKKMGLKGWVPWLRPSFGNSFAQYEAYVRMCKPKNDEEKKRAITDALKNEWDNSTGIFSW